MHDRNIHIDDAPPPIVVLFLVLVLFIALFFRGCSDAASAELSTESEAAAVQTFIIIHNKCENGLEPTPRRERSLDVPNTTVLDYYTCMANGYLDATEYTHDAYAATHPKL